ncbi:MAG TPA: hypothetical protein VD905_01710 [Flavobacteriales bacterium]|nr:hypothetical protein [Flavobacteriales bacterium]
MSYYLKTAIQHKDNLGGIRHWSNPKIGFDGNTIWIKDLDFAQVNSVDVKSIPWCELFEEKNGKLFRYGSRLPSMNAPSCLWTPLDRGLPVQLPAYNNNFFETDQQITITLVPSETEREAFGMMTSLKTLGQYLEKAPDIRMQKLQWMIVDGDKALIAGTPLLPIRGTTYWRCYRFLIPAGFDFETHALAAILDKQLNAFGNKIIVWEPTGGCFSVPVTQWAPLSLSSFRISTSPAQNKTLPVHT